jgi:hypothetical protein
VGPRADHNCTGPEYQYFNWYATANTDYVYTRSTFVTWHMNFVFSLFINFFLLGIHGGNYGTKTSKYYTMEFDLEEGF